MGTLLRQSRSLAIALVVLAMTGTVAFAAASVSGGMPAWARGHTTADASGAPESEAPESEAPESQSPDGSTGPQSPDASGAPNHGDLVSVAAGMATPDGFPNHGAFVACVAQMPHDVDPTTFDWTTVTPQSCGLAGSTVSGVGTTDHGHGNHRGHRPTFAGPTAG